MKTSDTIIEISKALLEVSKEMPAIKKNSTASIQTAKAKFSYQYADLPHILELIKPVLEKNSIVVMQDAPSIDANHINIQTLVMHTVSGEWIKTIVTIPVEDNNKSELHGLGSAVTYGRRYALSAALNIASEEDTDGAGSQPKGNRVDFVVVDNTLKNMTIVESREYYKEVIKNCTGESQKKIVEDKFKRHAEGLK